jgi:carbamoylphosphate synthase large subunit
LEGKGYIFEINPRLSTTSVLSNKAFGNEVELYIKYYNADEINNPPELKSGVYLYRYDDNVFVS